MQEEQQKMAMTTVNKTALKNRFRKCKVTSNRYINTK